MGQIVLLVVAAAWAAVLVPPLLRSRVENRPNSSVSDFRSQLSSLQRVLPSRGTSVRSMARPLAPSTLARPAAAGRPPLRSGLGSNHTAQPAPARTTSRDATRGHEPTARPRRHAERPERAPVVMRNGRPVLDAAEIKRRRTKVLYLIAGTAGVSGVMAATTDSKAMVYLFAVAVVALGAYVYLLAIANQRSLVDGPDYADERDAGDLYEAPPASRRSYRYDDDGDGYFGADTRAMGRDRDDSAAYRSTAPRSVEPSGRADSGDHTPGMGTSGRISYGRRPAAQPARSDAYGFETYDRSEPVRRPPARNGRHPTGQHPAVQRPREPQPVRRGYFPKTG